jgi:hypothetical protein
LYVFQLVDLGEKKGFREWEPLLVGETLFSRAKFLQPCRGFGIHWQMNAEVRLEETVLLLVRQKTERRKVLVLQAIAMLTRTVARAAHS